MRSIVASTAVSGSRRWRHNMRYRQRRGLRPSKRIKRADPARVEANAQEFARRSREALRDEHTPPSDVAEFAHRTVECCLNHGKVACRWVFPHGGGVNLDGVRG